MAASTAEEPAPPAPSSPDAANPSASSPQPVQPVRSSEEPALTTASCSSSCPPSPFPLATTTASLPPLSTSPSSPRRQQVSSASSSPGVPSSSSANFPRLVRRQSTQDRLDAILETARQRAEDLAAAEQPRRSGTSVRPEPLLRNQSAPGAMASPKSGAPATTAYLTEADGNTSADETTGIMAHNSRHGSARHLNYQSIASGSAPVAGSAPGSGARSRRSTATERGPGPGPGPEATVAAAPPPWWSALLANFQSIELENKGSVARDHLALERTFLAWLRTSLAFASIGIAVTQLFRLNTSTGDEGGDDDHFEQLRRLGRPLGTTFLAISILILFLGYQRYYQSQQWIIRGKFPASRGTILVVSLVALGLMVASLVVVVVVQPAV